MNGIQGFLSKLAPVLEWLGTAVASVAVIVGQANGTNITHNPTALISAVLALFGHATAHTTSGSPTGA